MHTATFSQANLSQNDLKPPLPSIPQSYPIISHKYLSYCTSYTVHGGGACGFVCRVCARCVIKDSHRGLQGWATLEKQRILGCHLLIFTQFKARVWGPLSLTAFGQHSDKWKSAVARVPRVGQVQVENPPTTPSSISPSLSADVPRAHTSVALSNASLPQNKNDNKFPVEHNRRDDWGAEI